MHRVCGFCDYFVLMSGDSLRHVNALAHSVEEELAKDGAKPLSKAVADDESGWIVRDYSSVVVHVFHTPLRDYYALERLWSDATRVRIPRVLSV